jgi:hypothetical protein
MRKIQEIILRRKVTQLSAAFFALMFVAVSCKKELSNVGDNLTNNNLNQTLVDTFSLITYSELVDSLETDETSISLLGAYHDPVFGRVDCGIVTQIVPSSYNPSFPSADVLTVDSVVIALRYSSINYYANISDLEIEVYEITDELVRNNQVYIADDIPNITGDNLVLPGSEILSPDFVKEVVVGTDTLSPQLRIHLNTIVGEELIADAAAGLMDVNFQNTAFKGLYIKATDASLTEGSGTVLYFALEDLLSKLTIYYHADDVSPESFDLDINSSCARYNSIQFEHEGSEVQAVLDDPTKGEEVFYSQGSAIRAVIEFPNILSFNKDADGNALPKIINRAVLVLPIQDFTADPFDPSTSLFIARIVDDKLSEFTSDYGFGTTLAGNTVSYDENKKEFRFAMTQEIQRLLNGDIENVGYRVYSPAFFGSTIERIIFNGSNTSLKNKPRLEITYTEY